MQNWGNSKTLVARKQIEIDKNHKNTPKQLNFHFFLRKKKNKTESLNTENKFWYGIKQSLLVESVQI